MTGTGGPGDASRSQIPLIAGAITLNAGDAAIALGTAEFLKRINPIWQPQIVDRDFDLATTHAPFLTFASPSWSTLYPKMGPNSRAHWWRAVRAGNRLRRRSVTALYPRWRPASRMIETAAETKFLDRLRAAPFIAVTGGTYFVDHYRWEVRLPELDLVRQSGRPYVFMTQTMGPFLRPSRGYARLARAFDEAAVVYARDDRTIDAVRRITRSANVTLAPDMAFMLPLDGLPGHQALGSGEGRPRIGVSVRRWGHSQASRGDRATERFESVMAEFAESAVQKLGAELVFASTCQGVVGYTDDSKLAARIVERVSDESRQSIVLMDEHFTPMELATLYHNMDVVVSTRMHGAILSSIGGTPAIVVDYESKSRDLFSRHGLEALVHDYSTLDSDALISTLHDILTDVTSARKNVARVVSSEKAILERIASKLEHDFDLR